MTHTIGYRRVSTLDQNLDRQDLGEVDQLFEERISAKDRERPALAELLRSLRKGDEVRVWSIDRLARDLRDLTDIVSTVTGKEASIRFLSENLQFDPAGASPFAELQLHLMGAFAQFERSIIRQRQAEGIAMAKARGVYKGGKKRLDRKRISALHAEGVGATEIARRTCASRASVYRVLDEGERR
jgi:DNA invertase Pin-like site-specific DNA recombinase